MPIFFSPMWIIFALLSALNLLDAVTTVYLCSHGYSEANALMRQALESGMFISVKLASSILFLAFACISYKYRLAERIPRSIKFAAYAVLLAALLILAAAVLNNILLYLHSTF
jgi:hypothetical protein